MRFYFTRHSKGKFFSMKKSGFSVNAEKIKKTILSPIKKEKKSDGTFINTTLLDKTHVLRVVYRSQDDIMIIITFYPGRKKFYL